MAETQLEPGRCLLFVYGSLQPGHRPPVSMRRSWPDRVRGLLYDLGPYPAAVKIDQCDATICGHVLEISEAELEPLDQYEGVGQGLYRRLRTVTATGAEVWVYEYTQALPPRAAGPMEAWPAEVEAAGTAGEQVWDVT